MPLLEDYPRIIKNLAGMGQWDHIFAFASAAASTRLQPSTSNLFRARDLSREQNFAVREANPRRRCASPKSLFFDFDEENNLYGDYVHMDGKARRYSAAVMRAAAAWLREALAALSECVSAP